MKTIALFMHQPYCSVQSGNGVINALTPYYKFKVFTKHELEDDFFDDVDAVCVPGGFGDADKFDMCLANNGDRITKFVQSGGKYLGICMGGYWADSDYLGILPDDIRITQYIKRPNTDTRRPHAKHLEVIWDGEWERMYFYDGFAVAGSGENYEVIATYMNGDPMAIIKDNIGLIGCHPESQKHWYDSYSWMKGKYHDGRHYKLLLEFVNKLMEN
ncbi:MAG: hypothetical protein EBU90_20955 [Proteobacteria bacterium]|nr:hypothetical protein [Pseudomonadota bacterium]